MQSENNNTQQKGKRMKYRIKILEVLSTIREIEAPNVDTAIAKA